MPASLPFTYVRFFWCNSPKWARASSFTRFLDHTKRRNTVGRTPLDEWSARRSRDLYLTKHSTHNRQTSMSPVGFEPTISEGERPQTYALVRTANWAGFMYVTSGGGSKANLKLIDNLTVTPDTSTLYGVLYWLIWRQNQEACALKKRLIAR